LSPEGLWPSAGKSGGRLLDAGFGNWQAFCRD
jgi:hypothetical protein